MIRRIQALNYRCLQCIDQEIADFQILMGPNASGKSTLLDVVAFLGDLVSGGLEKAIGKRTNSFQDLIWQRSGGGFELAIEFKIPDEQKGALKGHQYDLVAYEVAIGLDEGSNKPAILSEKVLLKTDNQSKERPLNVQLPLFPIEPTVQQTLISLPGLRNTKTVINKVKGGNDNFYSEIYHAEGKGWVPSFKLGSKRSALGNLPADEARFPVSTWLQELLTKGVQRIALNSVLMRKASPPGQGRALKPNGSNLSWVVDDLQNNASDNFTKWVEHLQTALPDIRNIRVIERFQDKHKYLTIEYAGGLEIPSWMASDGTLRLLALTLLAYLPDFEGIYLIEGPENGVSPRMIESVFQSLCSVRSAQILMATHSPAILSVAEPSQILCFAKTPSGAVDIVRGDDHPAICDWKGKMNLGVLFEGGVLG